MMKRHAFLKTGAFLLVFLIAAGGFAVRAGTSESPQTSAGGSTDVGRGNALPVLFYSGRNDNKDIYILHPGERDPRNLTNHPAQDLCPAPSPDGKRVLFLSDRGGNMDIYGMTPDGSDVRQLTATPEPELHSEFTPDGHRILFVRDFETRTEIWIMNADGSEARRLTNNEARDERPFMSPDGSKIIFMSNRDGNYEIYAMAPDGSGETRLTNTPEWEIFPVWSPDGTKIAYAQKFRAEGRMQGMIRVMNADGTGDRAVTAVETRDENPMWSPDGRHIILQSVRDGNFEVYQVDLDGNRPVRLTDHPAWDGWACYLAVKKQVGTALLAGSPSIHEAAVLSARSLNVLVLLGEWFGDAYFPLAKEIEARGWTMKRIGLDGEYRGCYNKKRDVVLRSDILIPDLKGFAGYDGLIIPSGPQWRKFNENRTVLKFVQDAHAAGLIIASFCVGNTTVKAAGLVDLPAGPKLYPDKVTLVKERVLIGPRGGGPPPGDGYESAPIKEICDAVAREAAKSREARGADSQGIPIEEFFGQARPGAEAVKFAAEIHTAALCPHGQLAFVPDGSGVFWSAISLEGRQQTIYWSAFDGKAFSRPVVAPFAAPAGNGGPAFSPDGRRLFFSAELPPEGGSSAARTAICCVERTASGWSRPEAVAASVDDRMTKGQVSVALSGNIYFSGRVLTERAPGIWMSRFADGRYGPPEKLAGPLAEVPLLVDPWVDPDEKFLLVSCTPPEGPPMLTDIGICFRKPDGSWDKPARLGPAVNTEVFERFPSLSRDGKFLFFIRSSSEQFVGDQAHFAWIETKDIPELKIKRAEPQTPEVFAPAVVSGDGIQMKLTMTADGSEILYTERDPATNAASFIIRRRAGDSWGEPLVLPYAREYLDIEPSLSPDGKKIVFVSNRPRSGMGEPEKMPDIWMAEREGDKWGDPVRLGPPICADDAADIEAHPAFGPDGGIYFMRQNGKTRRLFLAARRGAGFNEPMPLPLKEDLLAGQFSGPCLSPDGRILLMHSRKESGFGNWDLYVAFKDESGDWSELENLGPAVNTDKPESSPTFSPDGQFFFFTRETDIYWVSAKIIEELRPKEACPGPRPTVAR